MLDPNHMQLLNEEIQLLLDNQQEYELFVDNLYHELYLTGFYHYHVYNQFL